MPAIFISHSSKDGKLSADLKAEFDRLNLEHAFLDFDKETGLDAGVNWERRLYEEITRCHAVVLVLTPNWLASKWCFAEMTQARALGKVVIPLLCAPLGEKFVLPDVQAVDLLDWNGGGLQRLEKRLREISDELARGFDYDKARSPYPGINAFEAKDAAIYFGRDEESRAVIEQLDARSRNSSEPLVMIIGASGSGKSSLLKASVLPLLGRRNDWRILREIRPERAPMAALAKTLAQFTGKAEGWRDWLERLSRPDGASAIESFVEDARIGDYASATVLLPIDQFEEVFTTTPPAARTAFLKLLADVFAKKIPFMAIATGRSDVIDGLVESRELVGLYHTFPLPAMPPDRYERLITGPADVAGIHIEEGLSQRIARDVESKDSLPLLAHLLKKLNDNGGQDKRLTLAEYELLGDAKAGLSPIQNSIRLSADEAVDLKDPNSPELKALRDAFLMLVQVKDGKRVRQTARRAELPADAQRLIDKLVDARLLTSRGGEGGQEREALIEVTHESLFSAWPMLDQWLTDEHSFLADIERIRGAHANWSSAPAGKKDGELLYGLLLSRARDWMKEYPQRFANRSMEPLCALIEQSAKVEDAEKARAQRNRRLVFGGMAAAIALLASAAIYAYVQKTEAVIAKEEADHQRGEAVWAQKRATEQAFEANKQKLNAEQQSKRAIEERNAALTTQSRFLTGLAHQMFAKGDYGTAAALALEALPDERREIARPYVPAAESMLYQSVTALREKRTFEVRPRPVSAAKFTPDGRRVIMYSHNDNTPRIVDVASGAEVAALVGHTEGVAAVAFSPDRTQIVTASHDGTARTWSAADGKPLRTLEGHASKVSSAAFSPDSKRVVTTSLDSTARVWDLSGAVPRSLALPLDYIGVDAAFSPNGERIATISLGKGGASSEVARIWDAASGEQLPDLDPRSSSAWTDGRHVVTLAPGSLTASIWDIASGTRLGEVPAKAGESTAVFSPDGKRIAMMTFNGFAIWESASPLNIFDIETAETVSWPAFLPDGKRLAGYRDKAVNIWEFDAPAKHAVVTSFDLPEKPQARLDFTPDGRRLVAVFDGTVGVWGATEDGPIPAFSGGGSHSSAGGSRRAGREAVLSASLSPNGREIAATFGGDAMTVWDTASGELLASKPHPARVWRVAFLPDGTRVASVTRDAKLRVWDAFTDSPPVAIGEDPWIVESLAASPVGSRFATGSASDEFVRIWNAEADSSPIVSGPYPKPASGISFSPDGRHVIAVSDERAWLWNGVKDAAPVQIGDAAGVLSAAFSADGKRIVIAYEKGKVRILDAADHKEQKVWDVPELRIAMAGFSPDGTRILVAAEDKTARLWDAETGAEVAILRGHDGIVLSGSFSPDGRIVTLSRDRKVRLWPAFETTQALVDYARAVMPRELSAQQRKDFFLDTPANSATAPQ